MRRARVRSALAQGYLSNRKAVPRPQVIVFRRTIGGRAPPFLVGREVDGIDEDRTRHIAVEAHNDVSRRQVPMDQVELVEFVHRIDKRHYEAPKGIRRPIRSPAFRKALTFDPFLHEQETIGTKARDIGSGQPIRVHPSQSIGLGEEFDQASRGFPTFTQDTLRPALDEEILTIRRWAGKGIE